MMTKLFKKLFIKNYTDVENPTVRTAYGIASGIFGIVGNALLFALKILGGILSGSIAVIADAINNLSDFATSLITMFGFKLSSRPADKEHPYGHARFEYITGLIVACVILFIGIETGRGAIDKIISGIPANFTIFTCIVLGVSVIVKICMAIVFKGLGKSISSDTISAMSADSRNDAISTSIILICTLVNIIFDISLDGYLGIVVSIFVIVSAITLIKDTINPLIGCAPDKDFVCKIENKLKSYPGVIDIHDLIVHNYGPTKTFVSVHIEVDAQIDVMISHDLIDNIERDFMKECGIFLTGHLDPVMLNDPETNSLKMLVSDAIKEISDKLTLHDFRVVYGNTHTNVIFDVVVPFELKNIENDIRKAVETKLSTLDKTYYVVIEFDRSYN